MKNKLLLTTISLVLALQTMFASNIASFAANPEITVTLDGKILDFDVPPQIINDRTMVPVRKIFEKLNMTVEWNEDEQAVYAYKLGVFLKLPINSNTIYRNMVEQVTDVPAQIVYDRTLVPLRAVSELVGSDVIWDEKTNTVYINTTDNIQYINWNDYYDYYGEVENGKASGYGILYSKDDDSITQLGKYINSQIVSGSELFDNGDVYIGNYTDTKFSYGTYYYSSGDYYTGEFQDNHRHGEGTYHYVDGSFHKGMWNTDQPNGYGIFYDAVEDVQIQGNFINGKRDGYFTIDDFYLDTSYYITYNNGEVVDSNSPYYNPNNYNTNNYNTNNYNSNNSIINKNTDGYQSKMKELENEYAELDTWYREEMQKLYDYIQNGDPYSTDWGKSIKESFYTSYGVTSSNSSSPADSNLDSFAAANAMRQNAALKAKADAAIHQAISEYNATYIENWKTSTNNYYTEQKRILASKYNALVSSY